MAGSTQIAFQIDDVTLAEIDAMVADRYRSRAEVIRLAVHAWLAARHEEQVEERLALGYQVVPAGTAEDEWAELSVEGLKAADLDW
ncbi:hypothetical protein BH20ACT5_BH20ACT5_03730 [soil metagenome]